jgi:hypothetical protein
MAAAGFLAAYSASLIAYQKIRVLSIDVPYVFLQLPVYFTPNFAAPIW